MLQKDNHSCQINNQRAIIFVQEKIVLISGAFTKISIFMILLNTN